MTSSDADRLRAAVADDFEIFEELGRGGMAVVFRARDKALNRDVAIKVLPAHRMSDAALIDRFEHEARTAANLEHPHIIPIHRVGRAGVEGGDVCYFVMKLLHPQSLSDVLRARGTLPPDELRTLLIETVSALGYAAKRSVVHRDIKPGNILFDSEGRAIVTDFGIAKTPEGNHSAPGMLIGSPRYMSPEHSLGVPLDWRSDLYSLGVVAYEALFGVPPFDDENPLEIIYQHIHEPVPKPALKTAEHERLYPVIARMLAKRAGDRFQKADDVIVALGGDLMPHAIAEDPPATVAVRVSKPEIVDSKATTRPTVVNAPAPRRRMSLGAIGMIAVAAIALLAVLRPTPTPKPKPPARTSIPTIGPAPASVEPSAPPAAKVALASEPPKPRPTPKQPATLPPKPSARAAAILAYNKLKSSCAKRDTIASAKPIEYAIMMDSVPDRPRGDSMAVVYDVCGLPTGTRISTTFTLTKLRQRGFGQQKPYSETGSATAGSPRSRQRRTLDVRAMSPGSYRLDVVVTDATKRAMNLSREFRITDK